MILQYETNPQSHQACPAPFPTLSCIGKQSHTLTISHNACLCSSRIQHNSTYFNIGILPVHPPSWSWAPDQTLWAKTTGASVSTCHNIILLYISLYCFILYEFMVHHIASICQNMFNYVKNNVEYLHHCSLSWHFVSLSGPPAISCFSCCLIWSSFHSVWSSCFSCCLIWSSCCVIWSSCCSDCVIWHSLSSCVIWASFLANTTLYNILYIWWYICMNLIWICINMYKYVEIYKYTKKIKYNKIK